MSFATDVAPILQASCGTGGIACHGDPQVTSKNTNPARPYFAMGALAAGNALATSMRAGIVDVSSSEAPSLVLVKAGDSANSYLQDKVDGTQSTLAAACALGSFGSCGQSMPLGTLLPQAERDLIRAWISEGAPNN